MLFLKSILAVLISVLTPFVKNNTGSYSQVSIADQNSNSQPKISQYAQVDSAPVTQVNQLSDVKSTDWAFQALQSLSERYGCLSGYPNGTFQGNRTMTRFEFASALNSCMDTVQRLRGKIGDGFSQEDFSTLKKLQEQFGTELATLRGRVDTLEARTAELEANRFATTTKLDGQIIFAAIDAFGDASTSGHGNQNNATFSSRVRLNFDTSFTGQD